MSTATSKPSVPMRPALPDAATPPLQNSDRLTRVELEYRYAAMPELHNAQLIEGVVYMPSPVTYRHHGAPHFDLITWLGLYRIATPGVEGGDNATLRLDLDNAPQPDAFQIVLPSHGGQARIDADDYIVGAPELVAEVSATSVSIDLHAKLDPAALIGGDMAAVARTTQRGLASAEHADFVDRLRQAAARNPS